MKAKVEIFTSSHCPYCVWAKKLLEKKGAQYEETRIDTDTRHLKKLQERTDHTSVPQVFINDMHIGGYQEMVELDREGKLDHLLWL